MGDLFGGGPTDGDIERAEDAAYEKEARRLRLAEQKLRQRQSAETMQGSGLASAGDLKLGTDEIDAFTGLEEATGRPTGQLAGGSGQLAGGGSGQAPTGDIPGTLNPTTGQPFQFEDMPDTGDLQASFGGVGGAVGGITVPDFSNYDFGLTQAPVFDEGGNYIEEGDRAAPTLQGTASDYLLQDGSVNPNPTIVESGYDQPTYSDIRTGEVKVFDQLPSTQPTTTTDSTQLDDERRRVATNVANLAFGSISF